MSTDFREKAYNEGMEASNRWQSQVIHSNHDGGENGILIPIPPCPWPITSIEGHAWEAGFNGREFEGVV